MTLKTEMCAVELVYALDSLEEARGEDADWIYKRIQTLLKYRGVSPVRCERRNSSDRRVKYIYNVEDAREAFDKVPYRMKQSKTKNEKPTGKDGISKKNPEPERYTDCGNYEQCYSAAARLNKYLDCAGCKTYSADKNYLFAGLPEEEKKALTHYKIVSDLPICKEGRYNVHSIIPAQMERFIALGRETKAISNLLHCQATEKVLSRNYDIPPRSDGRPDVTLRHGDSFLLVLKQKPKPNSIKHFDLFLVQYFKDAGKPMNARDI